MQQVDAIHLRRATEDDAAAIAGVHFRSWQEAYRGLMPEWYLRGLNLADRTRFWQRELATLPEDRRPWVAECAGRVVGFVVAGPGRDPDALATTAEVYAISVVPDYWSTGVGRSLLDHQVSCLRDDDYDEATLWVQTANARAIRSFEKGRWQPDGAVRTEERGGVQIAERRYRLALR